MANNTEKQENNSDSENGLLHSVQPGDSIPSLAYQRGLYWNSVWRHPRNETLRQKRGNENVLLEGDEVFLPEPQQKEVEVSIGQRHRFRRGGVPSVLRLQLFKPDTKEPDLLKQLLNKSRGNASTSEASISNDEPEPWAEVECELQANGKAQRKKTDKQGMIEFTVHPDSESGKLVIDSGGPNEKTVELKLGQVGPATTTRGIKNRLRNLGFDCGDDSDNDGDFLESALTKFQLQNKLEPTGTINDSTRNELKKLHGS